MSVTMTGRREDREGVPWVVLERSFGAAVDDVWAAVTEPGRLARWIGTWTGDPASGSVSFAMGFEGDEAEPETMTIEVCEPPHRLRVTSAVPGGSEEWRMDLRLTEAGARTTLEFAQSLPTPAMGENVGPGWEYYLDRLVAAEAGGDVGAVVFEDYYPRLSAPYAALFAQDG